MKAALTLGSVALACFGILLAAPSVQAQNRVRSLASTVAEELSCPNRPTATPGPDFSGQSLRFANFSHRDLTNANFSGANLGGANFIRANLTGANFSGAQFTDSGSPARPADFTLATLDSACFIGAKFQGPTYFTYATLTAADFSNTDLSTGHAIFGDQPLIFVANAQTPRPRFRSTAMNCEFIPQWPALDLTRARIAQCLPQLIIANSPRDFSNAMLAGVDFSGQVLDGWKFTNAELFEANFNRSSLQAADLSAAKLQGAQLNNANLSGATLAGAFLSNDDGGKISNAAAVKSAHLRNANLANTHLSGVDFSFVNLYGSNAAADSPCKVDNKGFTVGCASVHGAQMTGTTFDGAYLYGLDLTDVSATGASFKGSILAGADFSGARIVTNPATGTNTSFLRAYLQGANLKSARLQCSSANCYDLTDAFVDFVPSGSNLYVQLSGTNHNNFAGCPTTLDPVSKKPVCRQDVCVFVNFGNATAVPANTASFTCPNHQLGPCGRATPDGSNGLWASQLDLGNPGDDSGVPPGWYDSTASYSKASKPEAVCGGRGGAASVLNW